MNFTTDQSYTNNRLLGYEKKYNEIYDRHNNLIYRLKEFLNGINITESVMLTETIRPSDNECEKKPQLRSRKGWISANKFACEYNFISYKTIYKIINSNKDYFDGYWIKFYERLGLVDPIRIIQFLEDSENKDRVVGSTTLNKYHKFLQFHRPLRLIRKKYLRSRNNKCRL